MLSNLTEGRLVRLLWVFSNNYTNESLVRVLNSVLEVDRKDYCLHFTSISFLFDNLVIKFYQILGLMCAFI